MPELPDIEVFRQCLIKYIVKKTITEAGSNAPKKIISGTLQDLKDTTEKHQFININRQGKHLIFEIDTGAQLIIHLMLRGRLKYHPKKRTVNQLSTCFWFIFEDDSQLGIWDPTHWAKLEIIINPKEQKSKMLSRLGPDADIVTKEQFKDIIKSSRLGRIKPLLMEQKKVAGIGNAYADEILWASKINPNKTASLLTDKQIETLYNNTKESLKTGIEQNKKDAGDSLDESERKWMKVYRKEGKPCPRCKTPIKHTKVNQRNTFFCPKCQA